jgi:hypothetical protein
MCDACVSESQLPGGACEALTTACGQNADCVSLANCLYDCADNSCADMCIATYPAGEADYFALYDCVFTTCDDVC